MAFDFSKAANKAAKSINMNEGSDSVRELPAAGVTKLRFMSYIELGKQAPNDPKYKETDKVLLGFELHGPKHPYIENDKGEKYPQRMSISAAVGRNGLNKKSTLYKLMQAMNYEQDPEITHIAQLLGRGFLGTVYHITNDAGKKSASLTKDQVPSVRAPIKEDEETGETKVIAIPEALGDQKCFLWDFPDADQWASIFIETDEKDGGYFQKTIKKATNFEGSPVEALLAELGEGNTKKASPVKAKATKAAKKEEPAEDDSDDLDGLDD